MNATNGQQRGSARICVGLAACALLALLQTAAAEIVAVDDQVSVAPSTVPRPTRGMTMKAVEAKFGAPQTRHEAVGKPPITRWDYAAFSVFFEKDRVVDSVVAPAAAPGP